MGVRKDDKSLMYCICEINCLSFSSVCVCAHICLTKRLNVIHRFDWLRERERERERERAHTKEKTAVCMYKLRLSL